MKVARTDSEDAFTEVWPENEASLLAFIDCQTQWRTVSSMAGIFFLGLDYGAVKVLLDAEDAADGIFSDLRTMEAAALPVLNRDD